MRSTHRARATAGAGFIGIVAGGLLAFASPAASADATSVVTYEGNPTCLDLGLGSMDIKPSPLVTDGTETTVTEDGLVVTYRIHEEDLDGDDTLFIDWSVDAEDDDLVALVDAVLVKQGPGGAAFVYEGGATDGTVWVIPAGQSSADAISHLEFCHSGPTTTTVAETTPSTDTTPTTVTSTTETTPTTDTTPTTVTPTTETTPTTVTTSTTEDTTPTTVDIITPTSVERPTTTEGPEVEGENEERTTTTQGPTVLGESVTRARPGTLPQTGGDPLDLAAIGTGLMIAGAVLIGASRRRLGTER